MKCRSYTSAAFAAAALSSVSSAEANESSAAEQADATPAEVQIQEEVEDAVRQMPCNEQLQLSAEARLSYENALFPAADDQVFAHGMSARLQLPNWKVTREMECRPSHESQDGLSIGYTVASFSRSEFLEREGVDGNLAKNMNSPSVSIVDVGWFGRGCFLCGEQWNVGLEGRLGLAYNSGATVRYQLGGQPTNTTVRPWGIGPAWGSSVFVSYNRFSLGAGINGSVAAGVIAMAASVALTYTSVPDGEEPPLPESKE